MPQEDLLRPEWPQDRQRAPRLGRPDVCGLAAAAVVIVVAATAAAQAVAVVVAAAAEEQDQDDDPPAATVTPGTVVTHKSLPPTWICYGLRRTFHVIPEV